MSPSERILRATLDCIVADGVAGLTLRTITRRAGVSVGAVSYHFSDKDGLLHAAFDLFTRESVEEFASFYEGVADLSSAREATVEMFLAAAADRRGTILGSELYALSLRRPWFRVLLTRWVDACCEVMNRHFDATTTALLDALYEGVTLHGSMRLDDYGRETMTEAVARLTPEGCYRAAAPNR